MGLYTSIGPSHLLKLRTNLVGADFVPVDLHAGDGEGTTEGLEGGVTHGGVGGVESGVEGLLGLDDGLHGVGRCCGWVTSGGLKVLLNSVVKLDVTFLIVVHVDLELAIDGGLASRGREGDLPCRPPPSVPVVARVEFGGGNANNDLILIALSLSIYCGSTSWIMLIHILHSLIIKCGSEGLHVRVQLVTNSTGASDLLSDVVKHNHLVASRVEVLGISHFSVFCDEHLVFARCGGNNLDHLLCVVITKSFSSVIVQQLLIGNQCTHISNNVHKLSGRSI